MDRFIEFNPVKFLQESVSWKSKIEELRRERDEIAGLNSINNDGMPHGTDIGKPTENKAVRLQQLEQQIIRLTYYTKMLNYILDNLAEDERDVIDIFFFQKGYIPPKIEWYGRKYGLCRSDVYSMRRRTLNKISRLAVENI